MTLQQAIQGKKTIWFTLTKQWYDMIHDGIKKEEYRETKDHWARRLFKDYDFGFNKLAFQCNLFCVVCC